MSLAVFARGPAVAALLASNTGCHGYYCRWGGGSLLLHLQPPRLLRLCRYLLTAGSSRRQQQQEQQQQQHKSIIFSDQSASNQSQGSLTPAQKVIQGGKDAGYGLVVLAGVLVTGGLFYVLGRELLSSKSPAALHSLALKRCLNDAQVQSALGEPIKSYGEGARRSRSRILRDETIDEDGVKLVTMKFYLEGKFNKAEVYVQGYMTDENDWCIKFLIVEVQRYPKRVIVLEKSEKGPAAASDVGRQH